jgi:hypothetical protein
MIGYCWSIEIDAGLRQVEAPSLVNVNTKEERHNQEIETGKLMLCMEALTINQIEW